MAHVSKVSNQASREYAARFVANLDISDGKSWKVVTEPWRNKRSLSQLRLKWAWVSQIADYVSDHTGYDKDDVNEWFKRRWLEPKRITIAGETVERYTTTDLTTAQMAEFMENIYRFGTSDLGLQLPLPPVATEER